MNKFIAVLLSLFLFFAGAAFAAVDLNSADQQQLESVKGIGPAKAKEIIDYRKKNGHFKSVDDLKNVKGFGEKSVNRLKKDLTVGDSKTEAMKPEKPAKK